MGKGEAITAGQEVGVMVADQMDKDKVGRMDIRVSQKKQKYFFCYAT